MHRRRLFTFLLLLCTIPLFGGVSPSVQSLDDRIESLLGRWQANEAFWGISIYDLEEETVLYSRNADRSFLPASNQKLLTSAAALEFLGSTHRYETALKFDGTIEGDVLRGDLILEGSGDPTFGSTEMRGPDPLEEWAEQLEEMGVQRVEGRLIGDDSAFDNQPYPEGWNVNYITRQKGRHMGTSASGLSYRDNVVPVKVRATRPGTAPSVRVEPEGVVDLDNRAETSSRWRGNTLQVERTFATNELVLTGSVARSYQGTITVPVSHPTTFTLRSFEHYLQEAGIETDLSLADADELDDPPGEGSTLFVELSQPLSEIISEINKDSNNFYAEQVLRTFGWEGSTKGAARRIQSFLRQADIDARKFQLSDGSGLSRKNMVTPRAMRELLTHMDNHEEREAFLASIPRGGERNTTLQYRLSRVPVQAKTGSLEYVRALSGYVYRPDGSRIVFVIFANNYTGPSYQISRTIDDIVELLTPPPS